VTVSGTTCHFVRVPHGGHVLRGKSHVCSTVFQTKPAKTNTGFRSVINTWQNGIKLCIYVNFKIKPKISCTVCLPKDYMYCIHTSFTKEFPVQPKQIGLKLWTTSVMLLNIEQHVRLTRTDRARTTLKSCP